jgi:O-acetyl-ADP-ribose deacetylase (regulator of RNase III)
MTIEFVKGDLFESGCEALVCPVNVVGVMGKGLAFQFKKRFPDYFKDYQKACRDNQLWPGYVYFFYNKPKNSPEIIISFPTKDHWKGKSNLAFIKSGLNNLAVHAAGCKIKSVAVPALGCGEGGLSFSEVKPLMIEAFEKWPNVLFKIYEPMEQ